jgi:hypothetical protein
MLLSFSLLFQKLNRPLKLKQWILYQDSIYKFTDLQKTLENNVILGTGTYLRTLSEAYTIAQNIKVVSQGNLKAAELPNTAFVVSAKGEVKAQISEEAR